MKLPGVTNIIMSTKSKWVRGKKVNIKWEIEPIDLKCLSGSTSHEHVILNMSPMYLCVRLF